MDIKIRNISPQVISEIDKIAKQEGVSQNTLYNKIISDYVKYKDDFVINILPAIVRSLVNSELERLSEGAKTTINNVYIAAQKKKSKICLQKRLKILKKTQLQMMKFCGYSKFQTKIIHKQGGFVYTIEIYTNYYSSKSIYFRYTFT